MSENLNNKVVNATKWSAITEFAAKLISPLSTIILARILTPDAFGVLVTATMVISFAEIFTDAGFQKYIIQHAFDDDESLNKASTVLSNLALSPSLMVLLSGVTDTPRVWFLVMVTSALCVQPLTSFTTIE